MMARTVPTSTVSSSGTRISSRTPDAGEGTSVSTLSVATSSRGSSASTVSPTALSQEETVPSVTDSPRAGIVTSVPSAEPPACGAAGAGASAAGVGAGAGAVSGAGAAGAGAEPASEGSPMMARTVPTSTVSSSGTRISSRTPDAGEGTSVSTLSVATSSRGSSASTVSPTALSQEETVPSVTDSPRAGIFTDSDIAVFLTLV